MASKDSARNHLESMLLDERVEPKALPISILESITTNFNDDQQIGSGGFGIVYKGLLQNGTVAVKKLIGADDMDASKFIKEANCLLKVKHKNIVRFLGYCADTRGEMMNYEGKLVIAENQQRLLCFEFVPNGSLDKYISDASQGLEWKTRYQIIKGICEGLHYLHQQQIVHLDLKPSNILLDQYMVAKISDFGLSKCFDEKQTHHITSKFTGSLGYMAPEFYQKGLVTFKSDIYSLGVMLKEILSGQKGCSTENVLESWGTRLGMPLGDKRLEPIRACAQIGIECTNVIPSKRPDTCRILEWLGVIEANMCPSSGTEVNSSISGMVDELKPVFVSEAPSPLQRISSRVPMGLGVTSTDILDVHPLELRFPWEQDIISPVTLTNWTDHYVGVWITLTCQDTWVNFWHPVSEHADTPGSSLFQMMKPRSTLAIPITTSHPWQEKPPSPDIGTFEVLMVDMGSKKDYLEGLKQSIGSRLNMDVDFLTRVEASGGEVHRAMLKATISDPPSCQQEVVTRTFIHLPSEFGNCIHSIDVHPTEPWFLVTARSSSLSNCNVFVLNYLTQEILATLYFVNETIHIAKFIAEEQWLATGDNQGYVIVHTNSTKHKVIKRFSPHNGNRISALAVHPTCPFLLTGSYYDQWIKLWDWSQGWKCTRTLYQSDGPCSIISNPLDADTFACAAKNSIAVWELSRSKEVGRIWDFAKTMDEKIWRACCFGGDGHTNSMITCSNNVSEETCARIWNIVEKKYVHDLFMSSHKDTTGVAWHPTLPLLATSHPSSRTVCFWDARTYRLEKIFQLTDTPVQEGMVFISTIKDGPMLVVGCKKGIAIMEIHLPTIKRHVATGDKS